MWYHRVIGRKKCPIVDTWWQTETGGILITPLPGAVDTKPGSATLAFPGIDPEVYNQEGDPVTAPDGGLLVLRKPWPGMLRGIWGDPKRYQQTYWSKYQNTYLTGDGAHRDRPGLLLDHGASRRRDEHLRSPDRNHGGGERPGLPRRRGGGRRRRPSRRDHRHRHRRLRHAQGGTRGRTASSPRPCAATSPGRSGPSPGRRTSASPRRCRRPAPARSCAACCATSPRERRPSETRPLSRTTACSRDCGNPRRARQETRPDGTGRNRDAGMRAHRGSPVSRIPGTPAREDRRRL